MARQAHSGKHVRLEKSPPVGVVDFKEWPSLKDAEIVDQYIKVWDAREERLCAFFGAQVGGNAIHLALDLADGPVDALLGASIDIDECAFAREEFGDGESDARGGAGDERALAL